MGTMTITIDTGSDTYTHSRTVSGASLTRLATAYKGLLGRVDDGAGGERDMTDTEVMEAFANGFFDGTKANVLRYEQSEAGKTASDGITEISMT